MLPPDGHYLFGRVISTTAMWGFSLTANLIYVYMVRSGTKTVPDTAELRTNRLLIAPLIINRLPWSRGYFETIGIRPFGEGEVLRQHCFRDSYGRYYDEQRRSLSLPSEPCGQAGLHSYRTLDDQISDALGIPRVPD